MAKKTEPKALKKEVKLKKEKTPRFEIIKEFKISGVKEFVTKFKLKTAFKKAFGMELSVWLKKGNRLPEKDVIDIMIPKIEEHLPTDQAVFVVPPDYGKTVGDYFLVYFMRLKFDIAIGTENYVEGRRFVYQMLGDMTGYVRTLRQLKKVKLDKRLEALMGMVEKQHKTLEDRYGNQQIALYFSENMMGRNFLIVDGYVYQLFLSQLQILGRKFDMPVDVDNSIASAVDIFALFIPLVIEAEDKASGRKRKRAVKPKKRR